MTANNRDLEHFYIISNEVKDPGFNFSEKLVTFFGTHGKKCTLLKSKDENDYLGHYIDPEHACVIVVGGDGSVLRANHQILGCNVPILGINLGTLGYLSEVERTNWQEKLEQLLEGRYELEERMMIEGRIISKDGVCVEDSQVLYALNDAVVGKAGAGSVLNFNVYVDGDFLNNYIGDGIIFSTATGSTAYNLSAGGPIVEPKARLVVVTPICCHAINNRSIILSKSDRIVVEMMHTARNRDMKSEAVFDGSRSVFLQSGDRFEIRRSNYTATLVKLSNRSFLSTLQKKILT